MNQYEMKQKAYQSTLKSRALQVLVYLIDRSNKEGTCFPAISTMSRELHISVSTVKRALRELTESGFVKKECLFREKNNGQTSNLYTLCFLEEDEVPMEEKIEGRSKDEVEEVISQDCVAVQKEKKFETAVKSAIGLISSICAALCHNLYWPGGEVSLIPP